MNRMKAKMVSHCAQSIFFSIEIPNRATYTKHLCFPLKLKKIMRRGKGKKRKRTEQSGGMYEISFKFMYLFRMTSGGIVKPLS